MGEERLLSHNIEPDNAFRPRNGGSRDGPQTQSKAASEGRNNLFTPESIKDALSVRVFNKMDVKIYRIGGNYM